MNCALHFTSMCTYLNSGELKACYETYVPVLVKALYRNDSVVLIPIAPLPDCKREEDSQCNLSSGCRCQRTQSAILIKYAHLCCMQTIVGQV